MTIEEFSIPEPNSGCWIWLRAIDRDGYGVFTAPRGNGPRMRKAHRISYEHFCGAIPDGLSVLHRCDNPSCVNPDHLYCGTAKQNARDALSRKRFCSHGKSQKLSPDDVNFIRASPERTSALAAKFVVHRHTIQLARVGKTWKR